MLGDLIQQEENFETVMCIANNILDQCSDDVEKQLNLIVDGLNTRWVTVSDIIVNLEINIYSVIQLWAAYEWRYSEVQAFIDDLMNSIQKEPLESSDGDTCLLPKYKVKNDQFMVNKILNFDVCIHFACATYLIDYFNYHIFMILDMLLYVYEGTVSVSSTLFYYNRQ